MARITNIKNEVAVTVTVQYECHRPLNNLRTKFIEDELQKYADGLLRETLRVLRFNGEEE